MAFSFAILITRGNSHSIHVCRSVYICLVDLLFLLILALELYNTKLHNGDYLYAMSVSEMQKFIRILMEIGL